MRFFVSFIINFFLLFTVAAGNDRSLEWFRNVSSGTFHYDFTGSVKSENASLPMYSESLMPEITADDYIISLSFPVFEKIGSDELNTIKSKLIDFPDSIDLNISSGIAKKRKVVDISFFPYIKKGNTYFKLSSFKWNIKPLSVPDKIKVSPMYPTITESALSKGKWIKLGVNETGLYKLTYQDITGLGINPDKVQVYGYGGALLEEDFAKGTYFNDLPEVALWKNTGSDGIFNNGDFILFYAKGSIYWTKNINNTYSRVRNHYSDKAYYFLGEKEEGTLLASTYEYSGIPDTQVNSFTDFILHETDRVNIGESVASSGTGRELYGEDFISSPNATFDDFNIPGLDISQNATIQTEFVAHNTSTSSCDVLVNNNFVHTMTLYGILSSNIYTYGTSSNRTTTFTPSGENISVKLNYKKNGNSPTPRAFLNFIILNVRKHLKLIDSSLAFRDPQSVGAGRIVRYTIQNTNGSTVVFDVTEQNSMSVVKGSLAESNYVFNADASILREYICADLNGSFPKPEIIGNVANQNIHGYEKVHMVIISPDEFKSQALRLAKAHTDADQIGVLVVSPEQVYNEFSSGTPDATAYRRMMKFFYDKAATEADLPKSLLLFGGGIYDNRMVSVLFSGTSKKSNHILTYQSPESLEGTQSYITDDYFGFLDDNEGSNLSIGKLDIGIGRFPVNTLDQAQHVVDKTLNYMANSRKGSWKNRLLYLADDGDDNVHMEQAEILASTVEKMNPEFMVNRIYVDAYKKVITASGSTIPDGKNRFAELLNSGLLMLNFTGHGSTKEWTAEKILTMDDVNTMTNKCLPLWVTATCDFTRYDAPEYSGGEKVFLNQYGGGIALFTTTRIVYSSNNFVINKSFIDNIFSKNNGLRNSLGDIMHLTKSGESLKYDRNKLSFTLIGDPQLKLAYPEYSVKVSHINDIAITAVTDTFKALDKVVVSGNVYREDGSFAEDFNGVIHPTVFDSREIVKTLGSDGAEIFSYYDQSRVIFSGKDSVTDGKFRFTFVIPKDIRYSFKSGSMNFYAYDNSGKNEAQGYYSNFALGGTNNSAAEDLTGPEIKLFLNDESFKEGGSVNEMPTLVARISDESGLNTSGNGIGHDLLVVIDENPEKTFYLNNYFMSDIGSFNSGVVKYVLPELESGIHSVRFRAWDVQNNSSTGTLSFKVIPGFAPKLSGLRFVQQNQRAIFRFTHDRPEVAVNVSLSVYDLLGRMVWSSEKKMQTGEYLSEEFEWDMKNPYGTGLCEGIFVCKVLVTDDNGSSSYISEKLRLVPQ